jgi:hypothetical protein
MNDTKSHEPERDTLLTFQKRMKKYAITKTSSFLGALVPQAEIVYLIQMIVQMIIVYIITFVSIINLSFQNRSSELWISLLSSCIGYALPCPKLKKL